MDSNAVFRFDDKMNFDFHAPRRVQVEMNAALYKIEQAELVRRLVEDEISYLFKHALVQDSAYSTLMKQQRKRLHQLVGEMLERTYPERLDENAARLAQHFAEAGNDAKTVVYAIRAGDFAGRVFASAEARSHYSLALEALERLAPQQDVRRLQIETLVKRVFSSLTAEPPPDNFARLEQAEQLTHSFPESDPDVQKSLAPIYFLKGFIHLMANETNETLRLYRQSRDLAQALHDDQLAANAAHDIALVLNVHGHFGKAEPLLREAIRLFEQSGKAVSDVGALGYLGVSLAGQGYYAQGLEEAVGGLMLAQATGAPLGLAVCHVQLAIIYRMGGDLPNMLEASRTGMQIAAANGDILFLFSAYTLLAWAQSCLGQDRDAFETLARANAISEMVNGKIVIRELCAAVEMEIYYNAGQPDQTLSRADQAIRLAREVDNLLAEGIAQRVWGQALARCEPPRSDEAGQHFAESLRVFEHGDARLETARTHIAWGKILLERGETNSAREHFEKAAAQFETSGLTRELEETRALLRADGSFA